MCGLALKLLGDASAHMLHIKDAQDATELIEAEAIGASISYAEVYATPGSALKRQRRNGSTDNRSIVQRSWFGLSGDRGASFVMVKQAEVTAVLGGGRARSVTTEERRRMEFRSIARQRRRRRFAALVAFTPRGGDRRDRWTGSLR